MRKLALLLIPVFICIYGNSQSLQIDSLKRALQSTSSDTSKASLLNHLAEIWYQAHPDSSMYYARQAYALAAKKHYKSAMGISLTQQGLISINTGKLAEGYEYYQAALQLFCDLNDEKGKATVYNGLGVTFGMQEQYPEAMKYFLMALSIQERIGSPGALAGCYLKIGMIHQRIHEEDKALESFEKALQLSRKAGDKKNEAYAHSNIGMLYGIKREFEKSLQASIKAKEIAEEINAKPGIATAYLNMGHAYNELKQYTLAETNLNKALTLFTQLKQPSQMARTYNGLANLYMGQKNYAKAEEFVNKSIRIAEDLNSKSILYDNYELLILIQKSQGKFKNVDSYYTRLLALKDTLFDAEKNNTIEQLKVSHLLENKQATIEYLKKENLAKTTQRNNLVVLVTIGGLLFALLAFSFVNIKLKNKVIIQRERELRELNTLKDKFFSVLSHDMRSPIANILISLSLFDPEFVVSEKDKKFLIEQLRASTSSVLETMDNLLAWGQHQLHNTTNVQQEINLKDLAERVCRFLKHSADNKSITISNKIDQPIMVKADEHQLEFTLRNLVSNSLKFSHPNSTVEVWANTTGTSTTIFVKDSGVGMTKEVKEKLFHSAGTFSKKGTSGEIGSGLGLVLAQQFIQENKGKLSVESEEGKGTTFIIELPTT